MLKWTAALSFFFTATVAAADDPREPSGLLTPDKSSPQPIVPDGEPDSPGLSGDWGGKRKEWSDAGVDLALVYKGEVHHFNSQGVSDTGYIDNLDLRLGWDLEKSVGWTGGSFFFYVLANSGADRGDGPSAQLGDAQGVSNIETGVDAVRLYQAWYQQKFFDGRFSVLAGLHDLNSEFYVTDASGLFLNASFGIGREFSQTGENGPSIFPVTAPGLRVRWEPSAEFYLQAAAYNARAGNPDRPRDTVARIDRADGTLGVVEAAYLPGGAEPTGKIAVGAWSYSKKFDDNNETELDADGNTVPVKSKVEGAYLLLEKNLAAGLTGFFRYGTAKSAAVRFGSNVGTGLVLTEFWDARAKDQVGLGVSHAENGADYMRAQEAAGTPVEEGETVYELNYRFEFENWALQPDVQHIVNPGTMSGHTDTVSSLRVELNF